MNSTAMSAKGRVRVSKHSAEELARLGRSDDGVDSGSEASGCSSGEEDDEVPARQRARRQSRPIMPRVSVRSDPLANVGSVRLHRAQWRRGEAAAAAGRQQRDVLDEAADAAVVGGIRSGAAWQRRLSGLKLFTVPREAELCIHV